MLFSDVSEETTVFMSHTDYIAKVPEGFTITAHTEHCPVAGMEDVNRQIYAVQFHPESVLTEGGYQMLANWLATCGDTEAPARAARLSPLVAADMSV